MAPQQERRTSPRKKTALNYQETALSSSDEPCNGLELKQKQKQKPVHRHVTQGKQVRLGPLFADFTLGRTLDLSLERKSKPSRKFNPTSGAKEANIQALRERVAARVALTGERTSDHGVEAEVEESIWCGSDADSDSSEEELPSPRKFLNLLRRPNVDDAIKRPLFPKHEQRPHGRLP